MAKHKIICGHVLDVLKDIPSESINCIVTSPPYWGLRKYPDSSVRVWGGNEKCNHEWEVEWKRIGREFARLDFPYHKCIKCGAWKGQLGLEPDSNMFIRHLCDIFDEIKRILRKDGTCWVNLADSYSNKSLCLIPFRFAIEMVNRGWLLRNIIIWVKPNPLPESVKDRFSEDYEFLFFFAKSKRYYFEQQLFPLAKTTITRSFFPFYPDSEKSQVWRDTETGVGRDAQTFNEEVYKKIARGEKLFRNMRCVWNIPVKPYPFFHFAVFPEELVETPIKAGCPEYTCSKCGIPQVPIYETKKLIDVIIDEDIKYNTKYDPELTGQTLQGFIRSQSIAKERNSSRIIAEQLFPHDKKLQQEFINLIHDHSSVILQRYIIGYKICGCGTGVKRGVVLDPFAGSGTVSLVAEKLGRDSISIEVVPEYCDMIEKRLKPFTKQQGLFERCIITRELGEKDE